MTAVVFLGPSLALQEAREHLPDAIFLPPATQGSVITAVERLRPNTIGLIDGMFFQDLSVWHKEILYALRKGITVLGASSMGALRAVELSPFGMEGVGRVYEQFACGELIDDDEVSLWHGPAEMQYRRMTEPMVNVRATLEAAVDRGLMDRPLRDRTIRVAKRQYFGDRTLDAIEAGLVEDGLDAEAARAVRNLIEACYVDVKGLDAVMLLKRMADRSARSTTIGTFDLNRSTAFNTLIEGERTTERAGHNIELSRIMRYALVNDRDAGALRFNALNRCLVGLLAKLLEVRPSAAEIDDERLRFAVDRGIENEEGLKQWIADNDLNVDQYDELLHNLASCRRLQRWWLLNASSSYGAVGPTLDELRLRGVYESIATAASLQEVVLSQTASDVSIFATDLKVADVMREHLTASNVYLHDPLSRVGQVELGMSSAELITELQMSNVARRNMVDSKS